MKQKKTKHEFRSNTLPAFLTVGPVTLLMVLLVAVPPDLCGRDELLLY